MKKEAMTMKQAIFIMIMFILGNTTMIGLHTHVDQDAWISLLMGFLFALPAILIYARIMSIYPEKNIFEVMQDLFKPVIGKMLIVLMIFFGLFMASNVICIFNNFIRMTSLISTPRLIVSVSFLFVSVYLALSSIASFGRGSVTVFYILLIVVIITFFMSLGKMNNLNNLFPIANHSFKELAGGAWTIFSMPFAETVLFLGLADAIIRKKKESSYKTFIYAALFGFIILLYASLRNEILLGASLVENSYFPSYRAARLLGIRNFLERIEGALTYDYIMAGIARLTICIIFVAKGTTKLFGLKNYKTIIPPLGLLILSFCLIGNDNIIQIVDFLETYRYYAIPFEIAIPLIVWIGAEIKMRNNRMKKNNIQSVPEQ